MFSRNFEAKYLRTHYLPFSCLFSMTHLQSNDSAIHPILIVILILLASKVYSQDLIINGKQPFVDENFKIAPESINCTTDETKTACQQIIAVFDTIECIPVPQDTGLFFYFRVCLGDSVFFKIKGIYPQNDNLYHQSDSLSIFTWNFGDGTKIVTDTPCIWHTYDTAKGFEVSVYIIDTNDCLSLPLIGRVTVTSNPINQVKPMPEICLNDTVTLHASTFTTYSSYSYSQITSQKFDSLMFIPDGPNCNPTNPCYNTDVFFTSFLPNQTITSADDILSICVFMEHSYVGDLNFRIICPNGQNDTLKEYIHWGGADMGIPGTPDQGCNPVNNPVGIPWNYCWSEIYPNIGTINANAGKTRLDSTDRVNQINYYLPDGMFSNLVGCPLNGKWTIEICDKWAIDNGYIFEWTLNLSPELLPQAWGYTAEIDSAWVEGPFIIDTISSGYLISPSDTGLFSYTVYIADNFGCTWDTTVFLRVLPLPEVNLGSDTAFCAGNSIVLDAGIGMKNYLWNTGSTKRYITVSQGGIYSVTVTASNNCKSSDSIEIIVHPLPPPKLIHHN